MTTTPNTMRPVRIFSTHAWSMEHRVISVALEMLARQILLMRLRVLETQKFIWARRLCQFELIGTLNQTASARHSAFQRKLIRGYHRYL